MPPKFDRCSSVRVASRAQVSPARTDSEEVSILRDLTQPGETAPYLPDKGLKS
jgi:hypothetical protein